MQTHSTKITNRKWRHTTHLFLLDIKDQMMTKLGTLGTTHIVVPVRDGPFDIRGGGGGAAIFLKKIVCFPTGAKKIKCLQRRYK